MKVVIVGAGPAGLYAAILIKRWRPETDVQVIERNAENETFGFGVVFSDQALAFLRSDDPETADLVEPSMIRWNDIELVHRNERIAIDGIGFSGISRLQLLAILTRRARNLGARLTFGQTIENPATHDADLIIGADGLNSIVRTTGNFGEKINSLSNRFAWFGTAQPFRALTQTFVETHFGRMNAHHYSYEKGHSTFIVEMPNNVYERTGFADMSEDETRKTCERAFATTLNGAPLTANHSIWRQFPVLSCERWHDSNRVLVGDALHTAHFSIGSGTRLALEDVIALVAALRAHDGDVTTALPAYQAARQPILQKLTKAATASGAWYDRFAEHMNLAPWPFALSYIQRAGRLDANRLAQIAPQFTSSLKARGLL